MDEQDGRTRGLGDLGPGGGGGVHVGVAVFVEPVAFHEWVHHQQPDIAGAAGGDDGVAVGMDDFAGTAEIGHAQPAGAAGMQEQPAIHRRARNRVQLHQRREPPLGFGQRVFEVQHPGGNGVVDMLAEEAAAGGDGDRHAEAEGGFADAARGRQHADEAADQPAAVQPFARRNAACLRQGGGDGGERGRPVASALLPVGPDVLLGHRRRRSWRAASDAAMARASPGARAAESWASAIARITGASRHAANAGSTASRTSRRA